MRRVLMSCVVTVLACSAPSLTPDAGLEDAGSVVDAGTTFDAGTTSSTVGADGGALALDNVKLLLPPGAVPTDVALTVQVSADAAPTLPGVTAVTPVFEFGPAGTQFTEEVSVTFDVTPATADQVLVVYWTKADGTFEARPSWWSDAGRVYALTSHLSRAFVGRLDAAPAELSCGRRVCLPSTPRAQTKLVTDTQTLESAGVTVGLGVVAMSGTPRDVAVRDTPVRPRDVGLTSVGAVADVVISPIATRETAKLCFTVPTTTKADEACLAFFDEGDSKWKCEDECLKVEGGGRDLLCGQTTHFTNFAILLGSNSSTRMCKR